MKANQLFTLKQKLIFEGYKPSFLFQNNHFNTIYTALCSFGSIKYDRRESLQTDDTDFFHLDIMQGDTTKVLVLLHGLEGSSYSNYIKQMVLCGVAAGYSVAVINQRGCSGQDNQLLQSYHSGFTNDLDQCLHYLYSIGYKQAVIAGVSLGANQLLKYLQQGQFKHSLHIKSALAISVPCDLKGASEALEKRENFIYREHFLKALKRKALNKIAKFNATNLQSDKIKKARTLKEFDHYFTAPVHGFADALDYYSKCSTHQDLHKIAIPCLILNAKDDPFLSPSCFPNTDQLNNKVESVYPLYGGHAAFSSAFYGKQKPMYIKVLEAIL